MGDDISPERIEALLKDLANLDDAVVHRGLVTIARKAKSRNGFAHKLVLADIIEAAGVVLESEGEELAAIAAFDHAVYCADKFGRSDGDGGIMLGRRVRIPDVSCELCEGRGLVVKMNEKGNRWAEDCPCKIIEPAPEVSERVLIVVMRLGGWVRFKNIHPDKHPFMRKDFLTEYVRHNRLERYKHRLASGETTGTLLGSGESLKLAARVA